MNEEFRKEGFWISIIHMQGNEELGESTTQTKPQQGVNQAEGRMWDVEEDLVFGTALPNTEFHLTPVQMAGIRKTRHVVEDVDQGTLIPFFQEGKLV